MASSSKQEENANHLRREEDRQKGGLLVLDVNIHSCCTIVCVSVRVFGFHLPPPGHGVVWKTKSPGAPESGVFEKKRGASPWGDIKATQGIQDIFEGRQQLL